MEQKGMYMKKKKDKHEGSQKMFGHIMREYRRLGKNYSYERLAELTDTDANNLIRIERDEKCPEFVTLIEICYVLEIDITKYLPELIEQIRKEKGTEGNE